MPQRQEAESIERLRKEKMFHEMAVPKASKSGTNVGVETP